MLRFAYPCLVCFYLLAGQLVAAEPGKSDWPQWRGPNRDGVNREQGLLKAWPEKGPPVVWQVDSVGVGYSSISIKDGRIFTQGDLNGVEHTIALNLTDGKTLWAVLPEAVEQRLATRVAEEMKRADLNQDGVIDEAEGLQRFGWNLNRMDMAGDGNAAEIAATRAKKLVAQLDKNADGALTFDEAGQAFRESFFQIDADSKSGDAEAMAQSRARDLLAQLDADKDQHVSRKEAARSLLDQPFNRIDLKAEGSDKGDEQLTTAEIEGFLLKNAKGQDGNLSAEELTNYFTRVHARKDGQLTEHELKGYHGGFRDGNGDGPRGTPTVDGDRLYVEGANGDLSCLAVDTGKTIWHLSLVSDLGGGRPGWGYCESPLVDGNLLFVTPGGNKGTVVALDKMTGQLVWRSESVKEGAHYSSPVLADINGVKQIVQFARSSVFGVRLADGQLLWNYSGANNGTANITTPIVHQNHVFASSGYGTGGGLAQIIASGDGQRAEEVYFEKKMANHHGGIVLVDDHLYGFGNGGLICMNYLTGKIAWQARSVGKGSVVCADGMLYCLGEGQEVALAEATPEAYREHGRFKLESFGRPTWAHPVVSGGRLYLRNQHRLTAYDVTAK